MLLIIANLLIPLFLEGWANIPFEFGENVQARKCDQLL